MRLPLLLSVPHAGLRVPAELAGRCLLTPRQVAEDGDEGAAEIYALAEHVAHHVTIDVARAVLDMNRPEDDRSKDGVVKTHTCWDVPIWRAPLEEARVQALLAAHHRPYHAALSAAAARGGAVLGVDCHTMAAVAPPVAPDVGRPRPAACLSHAGWTCPDAWLAGLARHLAAALGDEVRLNDPFGGGHITRTHAAELPWLQLELSRAPTHTPAEKRAAVLAALTAWCAEFAPARPDG